MQQISCQLCRNHVLVERYAENQLNVQWLSDAEAVCVEFSRRAGRGDRSVVVPECSALRATIELNIRNMAIRVSRRPLSADFSAESRTGCDAVGRKTIDG
jgi:hypothetical protein